MAITREEIGAAIAETKGMSIIEKMNHHNDRLVIRYCRGGYNESGFEKFSDIIIKLVTPAWKWDERPPIWYHGGPAGIKSGELLLPFPLAWNGRNTIAEHVEARLRNAVNPASVNYVYFTDDRALAIDYSQQFESGELYRVKPEGKLQVDPEVYLLFSLLRRDKEIELDTYKLIDTVLLGKPAFRAPTARVLGLG